MEKVERLRKKEKKKKKNLMGHRQLYVELLEEVEWREVEKGKRGINGDVRRLDLGW